VGFTHATLPLLKQLKPGPHEIGNIAVPPGRNRLGGECLQSRGKTNAIPARTLGAAEPH
jgi:hypothetical protein